MARRNDDFELDNKPISAWGYVGLMLLYCVPILGIIMLFVHAFRGKNINVRNFAKSYFIQFVIAFILYIVLIVLALCGIITNVEFNTDIFPGQEIEVFVKSATRFIG